MSVLNIALTIGIGAATLTLLLCGWRLLLGPTIADRVLALDTLYLSLVALVVMLGLLWQTPVLFEAALIVALLGFVGTVALARYLSRGDVVE
ncbi:MAG: K+/H+ antiporter subunit F [Rhodoferax sp.]|jgi:multicomponent K+:H+ antiporter subunit F